MAASACATATSGAWAASRAWERRCASAERNFRSEIRYPGGMAQQRVQSLDRALDLLEALASADELGVSEIAAKTGLVPSTAHRLLGTLVARGYAAQSPASSRYLLGYKLLELTSGLQDRLGRLRSAARPHLEAIQADTGETTNLVVLEGREVVYVDSVSGTRSVRLFTEIGRAIPAHTSGAGKALLAWRDPADIEPLLGPGPLHPATPRTLTSPAPRAPPPARWPRAGGSSRGPAGAGTVPKARAASPAGPACPGRSSATPA